MKICPECRTKNDDVNNFCKKCGLLIAGSLFKEKRVSGERKKSTWVYISLIFIAVVLAGVLFWIVEGKATPHAEITVQQKLMEVFRAVVSIIHAK